jgi:hypothetical protein
MSRAKVRVYGTEKAALTFALKLEGRMDEAYPELRPDHGWCCQGTSLSCDCGGETWAERWARESARVPPLIFGPAVDSRPVGEWALEQLRLPEPVPADVRERFEDGGRLWPIPEPVATAASDDDDLEDLPF